MTPWAMPPWQVGMMLKLADLGDHALVLTALPRQYGSRVKTAVLRRG